jgi:hypothetical protein
MGRWTSIEFCVVVVFAITLSHVPGFAAPRTQCDPQLFQDFKSDTTSDATTLSTLKIVNQSNFEEFRKNFGESVVIPIYGVPVDFGATWSSFEQKRNEYFSKNKMDYDERHAKNFLEYRFSDNSTRAYLKCIEAQVLSSKGLHLAWANAGGATPILIVTWLDTASAWPPRRNVELKITNGGKTTHSRIPIYSAGRQSLNLERDPRYDLAVTANIRGVDEDAIVAPADPKLPPPPIPPPSPVAYKSVYETLDPPDPSHTLTVAGPPFQGRLILPVGATIFAGDFAGAPIYRGTRGGCNEGYLSTSLTIRGCSVELWGHLMKEESPGNSVPVVMIVKDSLPLGGDSLPLCQANTLAAGNTKCDHSAPIGYLLK